MGLSKSELRAWTHWHIRLRIFLATTPIRVLGVVDGDTIKIEYEGRSATVRLIGVDTPETVHPNKPVEFFGKEASAFTKNPLIGESVYLRFGNETRDKYNRLLAYVFRSPDGLFVNLEIVRQGYGHAYVKYPFEHMELFRDYDAAFRQRLVEQLASAVNSAN